MGRWNWRVGLGWGGRHKETLSKEQSQNKVIAVGKWQGAEAGGLSPEEWPGGLEGGASGLGAVLNVG